LGHTSSSGRSSVYIGMVSPHLVHLTRLTGSFGGPSGGGMDGGRAALPGPEGSGAGAGWTGTGGGGGGAGPGAAESRLTGALGPGSGRAAGDGDA